jgi:hypothetical protein
VQTEISFQCSITGLRDKIKAFLGKQFYQIKPSKVFPGPSLFTSINIAVLLSGGFNKLRLQVVTSLRLISFQGIPLLCVEDGGDVPSIAPSAFSRVAKF